MSPFSRKCGEGDVFIVSTLRIPHGRILAKTRKNSVVPKMVSIRAILAPFRAFFASSDENGANSGDFGTILCTRGIYPSPHTKRTQSRKIM